MATLVPLTAAEAAIKDVDDSPAAGMSKFENDMMDALEGRAPAPAKPVAAKPVAKTEEPEEKPVEEVPAEVPAEETPAAAEVPVEEPKVEPSAEIQALQAELAKAKEGSAKAEQLQAELDRRDKAEPVKISADTTAPLADVFTHEALEAKIDSAGKWVAWCEGHPDGGQVKGADGKMVEWSADEVREQKASQNAILRAGYSRAIFIERYSNEYEKAKASYPTIFDTASPDYARRQAIQKEYPTLANKPNFLSVVGNIIEGEKVVSARKSTPVLTTAKPLVKPLVKSIPIPARGSSAAGGVRAPVKDADAEYNAALKSGNKARANNILMSMMTKAGADDKD